MNAGVETERLFFALQPDAATRARCADAARTGQPGHCRWVAPENIHLTLVFLGATTPEQRDCAERAVDGHGVSPFVLSLNSMGHFPKPQVTWLGTTTIPAELIRLVQFLTNGLSRCGFSLDARPYVPHVTVARKARRPPTRRSIEPIPWHCDAFVLMKSDTVHGLPRYEVLRRWRLGSHPR